MNSLHVFLLAKVSWRFCSYIDLPFSHAIHNLVNSADVERYLIFLDMSGCFKQGVSLTLKLLTRRRTPA
jgi:hypothetical protein